MTLVSVSCFTCGKRFLKTRRRFNEANKRGWKLYCSPKCQFRDKKKQVNKFDQNISKRLVTDWQVVRKVGLY